MTFRPETIAYLGETGFICWKWLFVILRRSILACPSRFFLLFAPVLLDFCFPSCLICFCFFGTLARCCTVLRCAATYLPTYLHEYCLATTNIHRTLHVRCRDMLGRGCSQYTANFSLSVSLSLSLSLDPVLLFPLGVVLLQQKTYESKQTDMTYFSFYLKTFFPQLLSQSSTSSLSGIILGTLTYTCLLLF